MADPSLLNPNPQEVGIGSWDGGKGITQPAPNRYLADLWSGVGDLATSGLEAADKLTSTWVTNEVRDKAGAEQEYFSRALRTKDNARLGGQTPPLTSQDPQDLQGLGNKLGTMEGARANGHISETYYYGRLDSLAKDLRSRYPGYRDQIDREFEKVTGVSPANAYIKSVIGDINTGAAKKNEEMGKVENLVTSHMGKEDSPNQGVLIGLFSKYKADPSEENKNAIFTQVAAINAREANYQAKTQALTLSGMERGEAKSQSQTVAIDTVNSTVADFFSGAQMLGGGGAMKPSEIAQKTLEMMQGKTAVDDVQMKANLTQMQAWKTQAVASLRNKFDSSGLTKTLGGAAERDKVIEDNMGQFNDIINNINSKDFGTAHMQANFVQAMQDSASANVLTNDRLKNFFLFSSTLHKFGGANWMPNWIENLSKRGQITKVETAMSDYDMMSLSTNIPGVSYNDINAAVADIQNKSPDEKTQRARTTSLQTVMSSMGDKMTTPEDLDRVKTLAAKHFNPNTFSLLNNFKEDYKDPQTGQMVKGRYAIFDTLTRPEVIANMKKLGPEQFENYRNWVNYSAQAYLLPTPVKTLQGATGRDYNLRWNSEYNQFDADRGPNVGVPVGGEGTIPIGGRSVGSPETQAGNNAAYDVQRGRLNSVLRAMDNVNRADGRTDPHESTALLIRTMKSLGMDVTHPVAKTIVNFKKFQDRVEDTSGSSDTDRRSRD